MKYLLHTLLVMFFSFTALSLCAEDVVSVKLNYVETAHQYQYKGLFRETEDFLLLANTEAIQNKNIEKQVDILNRLSDLYLRSGREKKSIITLQKAEDLARENNQKALLSSIYNNMANTYIYAGDINNAIKMYRHSADISLKYGDDQKRIIALINLSKALIYNQDYQKSFDLFHDLFRLAKTFQPSGDVAFQLASISRLGQDLLNSNLEIKDRRQLTQKIIGLYDAAALMAEASNDYYTASYIYGSWASIYQKQNHLKEAKKLLRKAIFLSHQIEADEFSYRWKWQLARLYAQQGDSHSAINELREAIIILQAVRPRFDRNSNGIYESAAESSKQIYFELADLLLKQPQMEMSTENRALQLLEARNTVELMKAVELQDYFKDNCVTALRTRTAGVDKLDPHTAVLYVIPLKDRLELLVSLPDGIEQVTVPVSEKTFRSEIDKFRYNLEVRTNRRYMRQAWQIYDWLIRPITTILTDAEIKTLVTVPQGALMSVPLAALHDGDQFLIEKYALAITPGLALTDPQKLQKEKLNVLLAGVSESVQGFPALPNVQKELDEIHKIFDGQILINSEFTRDNIYKVVQNKSYSIIHIASHAQFKGRSSESFILTHSEKMGFDRFEELIGVSEFRDEPLELLTMSACQTAAGDDQSALGLAGIAIKAGARSALASLWFVSDLSSSLLMNEFYINLKKPGVSKAQALQKAQVELLKDIRFRHPGYWAPFLLIGNWL